MICCMFGCPPGRTAGSLYVVRGVSPARVVRYRTIPVRSPCLGSCVPLEVLLPPCPSPEPGRMWSRTPSGLADLLRAERVLQQLHRLLLTALAGGLLVDDHV